MIDVIYIESAVMNHHRVQKIISRFQNATVIECDRYGEVFNPRAQNFRLQKQNPALILAEKFDNFVLPTPEGYGIGGTKNYYFSHMLNCIYDCRYCFLQGMYRSAHYLLFVNYEDFQTTIEKTLKNESADEPVYFFSGYDCDSLALESVTHFVEEFIPFFRNNTQAVLELRTKSIQFDSLLNEESIPNCVVAFSFTPDNISNNLEHGVPPVKSRINAMKKLAECGWLLGLRFDPLIYHKGWEENYRHLFQSVFSQIPANSIHSVSTGPLRFPTAMFETITRLYPEEKLFAGPIERQNGMMSYNNEIEDEMHQFCSNELRSYIPESLFFACTP
tara:strand:+ start:7543 stop:8538 length:996 start_codon:yes stop_codon:yes gene_type:complete